MDDCPDGEDEDPVLCGNNFLGIAIYPSKFLANIISADLHGSTSLIEKIFNISLAKSTLEPYEWEQCGKNQEPKVTFFGFNTFFLDVKYFPAFYCQCGLRTRVYCNHAQLNEVPQDISVEVSYM